jgi:antitoxin component YwqK of YwqJK toxin-antitoxin module
MPRVVVVLLLLGRGALGSNGPELAVARTKQELLRKLNAMCGTSLTVRYDGDSLRQHNDDIAVGATGGETECNEPLRYLFSLCRTEPGKALVRRAGVREVVCQGTPARVGSLTVKGGVVTVERAHVEPTPFRRARRQFEAAFATKLKVEDDDPLRDAWWRTFREARTPDITPSDVCFVDGVKKAFDWLAADDHLGAKTVRCLWNGEVVIDVTMKDRKKSGLLTQASDDWRRRYTVKDDIEEGLQEVSDGQLLLSTLRYSNGVPIWEKAFHPRGTLKRYWRRSPNPKQASLELQEDGRVADLSCVPDVRDDEVLRTWCGFDGEKTTQVFDGSVLSRTVTHRDGVLTKLVAASSAQGDRRLEVARRDDGTLVLTRTRKREVKWGLQTEFAEDGTTVIEELDYRDDELLRSTRYFGNGDTFFEELRVGPRQYRRTEYFERGGISGTGLWGPCESVLSHRGFWCQTGVHTFFFERGQKHHELTYSQGRVQTAKRWYENGVLDSIEVYERGQLISNTLFFTDGGYAAGDAFEADGGRALKR